MASLLKIAATVYVLNRSQCSHYEWLFDVVYGAKLSFDHITTDFVEPALHGIDVKDVWFQQDKATFHTSPAIISLLHQTFNGHLIRRDDDVNWPPRSCNLTPLEYFLWGAINEKCYDDKPETIEQLKANIRDAIDEIRSNTLEKAHKNWYDLLRNFITKKKLFWDKFQTVFVLLHF